MPKIGNDDQKSKPNRPPLIYAFMLLRGLLEYGIQHFHDEALLGLG